MHRAPLAAAPRMINPMDEVLIDGCSRTTAAIRDTGLRAAVADLPDRPGRGRDASGPAGAGSPTRCRTGAASGTSRGSGRSGSTSTSASSTARCWPTRIDVLHGAEERLRKFRYFTFEPAIDIDDDVLVALIEAAARRTAAVRRAPAMADDAAVPIELERAVGAGESRRDRRHRSDPHSRAYGLRSAAGVRIDDGHARLPRSAHDHGARSRAQAAVGGGSAMDGRCGSARVPAPRQPRPASELSTRNPSAVPDQRRSSASSPRRRRT